MLKNKVTMMAELIRNFGEVDKAHIFVFSDLNDFLNRVPNKFTDTSITYVFDEMADLYWRILDLEGNEYADPETEICWETVAEKLLNSVVDLKEDEHQKLAQNMYDASKDIILFLDDYKK